MKGLQEGKASLLSETEHEAEKLATDPLRTILRLFPPQDHWPLTFGFEDTSLDWEKTDIEGSTMTRSAT